MTFGEKVNVRLLVMMKVARANVCQLRTDCVYCLPRKTVVIAEDYAASFAEIIKETGANALVFLLHQNAQKRLRLVLV